MITITVVIFLTQEIFISFVEYNKLFEKLYIAEQCFAALKRFTKVVSLIFKTSLPQQVQTNKNVVYFYIQI